MRYIFGKCQKQVYKVLFRKIFLSFYKTLIPWEKLDTALEPFFGPAEKKITDFLKKFLNSRFGPVTPSGGTASTVTPSAKNNKSTRVAPEPRSTDGDPAASVSPQTDSDDKEKQDNEKKKNGKLQNHHHHHKHKHHEKKEEK